MIFISMTHIYNSRNIKVSHPENQSKIILINNNLLTQEIQFNNLNLNKIGLFSKKKKIL
jgi:hypothetical protein